MYSRTSSLILFLTASQTIHTHPHIQKPLTSSSLLEIPSIGLGLWNSKDKDATHAVEVAFHTGYHHLDSAAAYSNEPSVGLALSSPSTPTRSTFWITSKLWNTAHRSSNVPKAFAKTLSDLNTTYLDLYLMHWPVAFLPDQHGRDVIDQDVSVEDTWRAMEALVSKNRTHPEAGTARYIGISNFSPRQIDDLLKTAKVKPYAHEFETHPYLQQQDFVDWHAKNEIRVIAYSPLANLNPTYKGKHSEVPRILDDEFWKDIAGRKNVSVAQAVLGWGVQRGISVIPKSVHEERIKENLGAGEVRFSQEEMEEVRKQDRMARFNDPSKEWGVDLFEGLDDGFSRFETGLEL